MKKTSIFWVVIVIISVISACSEVTDNEALEAENEPSDMQNEPSDNKGNQDDESTEADEPEEPVTLRLNWHEGHMTEEMVQEVFIEPLEEEHSHITIDLFYSATFQEHMDAGYEPDITMSGITNLGTRFVHPNLPLDLFADLEEIADRNNVALEDLYDADMIESIRGFDTLGENRVTHFPIDQVLGVTYYNKDIFDMFGMSYPDDHSTWDELADLGYQLTGERDGMDYVGMGVPFPFGLNRLQTQLSVPYFDSETNEAVISEKEEWDMIFDMYERMHGIPGGWPDDFDAHRTGFLENRNLAINPTLAYHGDDDFITAVRDTGLNWGITHFPVWEHQPNVGVGLFSNGFLISDYSEKQDAAFQALTYWAGPEVQTDLAERGFVPAINDSNVRDQAYVNHPFLDELEPYLHYEFDLDVAPTPYMTPIDNNVRDITFREIELFFTQEKDKVEAMRTADEELNIRMQDYQAQN